MTTYKEVPEAILLNPEREAALVCALLDAVAKAISAYVCLAHPCDPAGMRARIEDVQRIVQHAKDSVDEAEAEGPRA